MEDLKVSDMKQRNGMLKTCQIVEQYERKNFKGWSEEELKQVDEKSLSGVMGIMLERLKKHGITFESSYGINHDRDERKVWDEVKADYVSELKPTHCHILLKFTDRSCTLPQLAQILGIEESAIEKPQKGRFAWDNMLAYLIHIKYPEKFQYSPLDVLFISPTKSYIDVYRERKEEWEKGRAKAKSKNAIDNIDMLLEKVLRGEVTREQVLLTDELFDIYSRYSQKVEDAFRVYGERRAYKTLQALKQGKFHLTVFFITGAPGAGKTRLAQAFVDSLIKTSSQFDERWRVCQTAATNPMDDYNGEEILMMDDVRGIALSASDWLKLLDPYNASPASARYHNKQAACRVVVITSTKEPLEFFYYCKALGGGDRSEAMDQFLRRIQCLTRVIKADDFVDTKVALGTVQRGVKRLEVVNNSETDERFHETVETSYHFDNMKEMSFEEAQNELLKIAMSNNKFEEKKAP